MGHNGISWDIMEYVYVHQQTYVYGCIHMYTYLLYKDREREREREIERERERESQQDPISPCFVRGSKMGHPLG